MIVEKSIMVRTKTRTIFREGLLVLSGAKAALKATPGMVGYGMAKAAVHHLTKSLAQPTSGLPTHAKVTAILP
jgi:dihydropteridine reductase